MTKHLALVLAFVVCFLFSTSVYATIGVGVGSGKIEVQDKLKPGMIYQLPVLSVMNTGDETGEYEVSIAYHEKQPQLKPLEKWFSYSPNNFVLEPTQAKQVEVKMNLPINAEPGEYFAYLEAHPAKKSQDGNTSVGVAAAAKLYFTVVPANPISGLYYKIVSFWKVNQPWSGRVLIAVLVVVILLTAKKFLKIQIGIKSKDSHE